MLLHNLLSEAQEQFGQELLIQDRGLILACELGHLELSWDSKFDEAVKVVIERKMALGMRFFIMRPILGGLIDIKRRVTSVQDIQNYKLRAKDKDIEELISSGHAHIFRTNYQHDDTVSVVKDAAVAVRGRTIGVPALAGG